MKYIFSVIIQKKTASSPGDALIIPALKVRQPLSKDDRTDIETKGLKPFLKEAILAILHYKEQNNESIKTPGLADEVLEKILKGNHATRLGMHDIELVINVDFVKKRCHFFSTILPPLTRLTVLAEVSAGTLLSIGTLQLTEGSIFPVSKDLNQDILIAQSILSGVLGLWLGLSSAGMAFIGDIGETIDDTLFSGCQKTPTERIEHVEEKKEEAQLPVWKIGTLKTIFLILVTNNLWTSAVQDYLQLTGLSERISTTTDSIIPAWLNTLAAYVAFGFNQLNDPIQIISLLILGFKMIDHWYAPTLHIEEINAEEPNEDNAPLIRQSRYPLRMFNNPPPESKVTINAAPETPQLQ